MMAYACNPSTQEAKAGDLKFEASLALIGGPISANNTAQLWNPTEPITNQSEASRLQSETLSHESNLPPLFALKLVPEQ